MKRNIVFLVALAVLLVLAQSSSAQDYSVAFKSANGQYLVAENGGGGAVNANRNAIDIWETFTLIDLNGGALVSGDFVNIRSFKGMFMVAENGGGGVVRANRRVAAEWEKFRILRVGGGGPIRNGDVINLQSNNGQYVVAENGGGGVVNANRSVPAEWEGFTIIISAATTSLPAPAAQMPKIRVVLTKIKIDHKKEGALNRADISFWAAKYSQGCSIYTPLGRSKFLKIAKKDLGKWISLQVDITGPTDPLKPGETLKVLLYEEDRGSRHQKTWQFDPKCPTYYYVTKKPRYGTFELSSIDFPTPGTVKSFDLSGAAIEITGYY